MQQFLKKQLVHAVKIATAFTPWIICMYVFYWLESSGAWTSETPHRGKISVALLAFGMVLSFLVHSHFAKHRKT